MRNHKSIHKATFCNPLKYIFIYNNLSSIKFVRWKITDGLKDFVKICSIIPKGQFVLKTQKSFVLRYYNNLYCWKNLIKVFEGSQFEPGCSKYCLGPAIQNFQTPKSLRSKKIESITSWHYLKYKLVIPINILSLNTLKTILNCFTLYTVFQHKVDIIADIKI